MSKFLRTLFIPTLGPANRKKLKSELGKICKKKTKKQTNKKTTNLQDFLGGPCGWDFKLPI